MTSASDELWRLVVPAERVVTCQRGCGTGAPRLSMSGPHIRADCPDCGKYIKFVKQIAEHPESEEPELYETGETW